MTSKLIQLLYPLDKRICYRCGSTTARDWIINWGTPFVLCQSCIDRLYKADHLNARARRLYHTKYREKKKCRFWFIDHHVKTDEVPRIGVCNLCRNVVPFDCRFTDMHHEQYDETDPIKHTMETCRSCHNEISNEKKKRDAKTGRFVS